MTNTKKETPIFINTQRNKKMMLYKKHQYYFQKINKTEEHYKCSKRPCPGKSKFTGFDVVVVKSHVCKQLTDMETKSIMLKSSLVTQALTTEIPTNVLVRNLITGLDENEIHEFNKIKNIQRRIQLLRQKKLDFTISENDDIPNVFKQTHSEKQFLLFEEPISMKNRILIFGNKENLIYLKNSSTWLADGTFYSAPCGFLQVYVLFCNIFDKHFPILYCLLQNKSKMSYEKMFSTIKNLCNGLGPNSIVMDFETAPMNAFKNNFCDARIFNCLFHFGQIVYRRLRDAGLATLYNADKNFRFNVKMLMSIVFLPFHRIESTFNLIVERFDFENFGEEKKEFINFFFKNYFEKLIFSNNNDGINALVRLKENIPLTTNCCEGWNRSLNSNFSCPNPSIAKFLMQIRTIESSIEVKINELLASGLVSSNIKDQKMINIVRITDNEVEFVELLLIKAIAINYNWSFE